MERQWPGDAAELVERAVTGELRSATGDGTFSRGRDMGRATVKIRKRGTGVSVEADGSMGVWAIVERGTRAHDVVAGRGKLLRTTQGPRKRVRVSGVRGRRSWSRGVQSAMPRVKSSAQSAFREVVG